MAPYVGVRHRLDTSHPSLETAKAMPEPIPQTNTDRLVLRDIATRGWHSVTIAERNDQPGWAFTIGLQCSFDHPEVVTFGLPGEANREVVERVARSVADGDAHLAGSTCDTILPGLPCEFRAVARIWYETLLGYATWYYGDQDFPVVQILWPDRDNRLPYDSDFDPDLVGLQPLLEYDGTVAARLGVLLHALDRI
jgi:hypothetical protein